MIKAQEEQVGRTQGLEQGPPDIKAPFSPWVGGSRVLLGWGMFVRWVVVGWGGVGGGVVGDRVGVGGKVGCGFDGGCSSGQCASEGWVGGVWSDCG